MKEKGGAVLRVVGTMSGTSLDGVDAAVIETDGVAVHGFGATSYRAYAPPEQDVLRAALGRWPGDQGVCEAAQVVQRAHQEVLGGFTDATLIGFHGQTLAHDPDGLLGQGPRTHQTGDGTALARALGRRVVWDFRSADVAAGGQGAPLAPVYHFALARWIRASAPLAILNLGGVGNLTWIDPRSDGPFAPGAMLAFDTGPANAPLNDLMRARRGVDLDRDGALAASGMPRAGVLAVYLMDPYFDRRPPKSLDRDAFPALGPAVAGLNDAEAAATLVAAACMGVTRALEWCPAPPERVLVTGGGRLNPVMMAGLAQHLPCPVAPVEDVGLNGDMIEAQAFAYLAVRALNGLPITGPGTTGVALPLTGARLALPT